MKQEFTTGAESLEFTVQPFEDLKDDLRGPLYSEPYRLVYQY